MHTVAIYLRLSLADEGDCEESNSIGNQRLLMKEYIAKHTEFESMKIIEYCDDGYSGTNFNRPQLKKLLSDVKQGNIQCIIVKDLSRFSRDYIELGTYMNQIFPFLRIRFIAINDGYDSNSHKGNTVELDTAFKTLIYDLYSKDISVKVKSVVENKFKQGEYASGLVPMGYKRENGRLIIVEKEAKIVRYIFQLASKGNSISQIGRILTVENIPTLKQIRQHKNCYVDGRSVRWAPKSVRGILKNRIYVGDITYGKSKMEIVGGKRISLPESEWIIVKGQHEPIISLEEFNSITFAKIDVRKKNSEERHPFVGKIICSGCGHKMQYRPLTKYTKRPNFVCQAHKQLLNNECCTYFPATILEEMILIMLNKQLLLVGDLTKAKENVKEEQKNRIHQLKQDIKQMEKSQKNYLLQKDELYEQYRNKNIDLKFYQQEVVSINNQIALSEKQQEEKEELLLNIETEYMNEISDMKQVIRYSHIESLTKEIVDIFIKKIKVHRDKRVEIEWNFLGKYTEDGI